MRAHRLVCSQEPLASVAIYIFLTSHARVSAMRDWSKDQPSSLPLVKERATAAVYRRVKTPQS